MSATSPATAFIDYYNTNNIIPVSQDLTDLDAFIFRRNYLYQALGLPLARIKNLNVVEFCPGGGYNAVASTDDSRSIIEEAARFLRVARLPSAL
jgi:hypothetical protein